MTAEFVINVPMISKKDTDVLQIYIPLPRSRGLRKTDEEFNHALFWVAVGELRREISVLEKGIRE